MTHVTTTQNAMTIGIDLGDRCSQLCVLDHDGATLEEGLADDDRSGVPTTVRVIATGADRH